MKNHDLKVSWRLLLAEPAYSLVVVMGLAVAIAMSFLVALLLNDRWRPDPTVPEPDRVVRLEFRGNIPGRNDDWFSAIPFPFRDALIEGRAPLTHVARVSSGELGIRAGEHRSLNEVVFADPDLVSILGLTSIRGDLVAALTRPDTVALTEVAAQRLFGDSESVIGKRLRMSGHDLEVAALLPVPHSNAPLRFDVLANFEAPAALRNPGDLGQWYMVGGLIFARMAPGGNTEQLSVLLQSIFDQSPGTTLSPPSWSEGGRKAGFARAVSLDRLPFDGAGSRQRLLLFSALGIAALTMLGMATINYVNLSSVRVMRRQREIAVRKSLGASPLRLGLQFIVESSVVALTAGAIGLVLAWLVAPSFADRLEVKFASGLLELEPVLGMVVGCLILGLLTGIYPARVALGVHCAPALQGRLQSEGIGGRRLRRFMTVVQFTSAMALSGAAVVVQWQSAYVANLDPGYRTRDLLAVWLPPSNQQALGVAFVETLRRELPTAKIAFSESALGLNTVGWTNPLKRGETELQVRAFRVGEHFFETYEVDLIAGSLDGVHLPGDEDGPKSEADAKKEDALIWPVVIDEKAVLALGMRSAGEAVGQILSSREQKLRVVAVTGPVSQESAREIEQPQLFRLIAGDLSSATINSENLEASMAVVSRVWPRYFPDLPVDTSNVGELLGERNRFDRSVGDLVTATSIVALLLAGFGVYALAAYTVRRSALEIVMRKLHGAGPLHIGGLLVREFAPLFASAAVFGVPLVWWAAELYLSDFVKKAEMGPWPMMLALVGTIVVSGLAGLRHAMVAMSMRPVDSLRD